MDIEKNSEIAKELEIDNVPKISVYREGKLVSDMSGLFEDKNALTNLLDLSFSDSEGSKSVMEKFSIPDVYQSATQMVASYYDMHLKFLPIHDYSFIGASVGHCAGVVGCQFAPNIVKDILGLGDFWNFTVELDGPERRLDAMDKLADFSKSLALTTSETVKAGKKFITIGGDHSCAIGTWSGVHDAIGQDYGLIWIDAHMDSHTPDTSPSKNMHGMPVATLMGHGSKKLTQILSENPKLKPENIVFLGIRSYEDAEQALLEKLNVKVFYIEDIIEKGFDYCWNYALQRFEEKGLRYGISFDLDGLDPEYIDALGTPEPNGIQLPDIERNFSKIDHEKLIGIEIVEYNPTVDTDNKGAHCIKRILESIPNLTYKL